MASEHKHSCLLHVVGNRPQFIKLAPVSHEIRRRGYVEAIVHTGQHYDSSMSAVFFEQLSIPEPDVNLGVGGGTHAQMTGKMMVLLEELLMAWKPKCVLLYGDTNSTLSGALAAAKLCIPFGHVEAGPRTFDKTNPEEVNRVVVDHLSRYLFCPDAMSVHNLEREGIVQHVYFTGDVMYDAFLRHSSQDVGRALLVRYGLRKNDYSMMTLHWQENTCSSERLETIMRFVGELDSRVLFPVHPRTKASFEEYGLTEYVESLSNVTLVEPLGYVEMVNLLANASMCITDSGGLSKESAFAGIKALFLMDLVDWKNLVRDGWIMPVNLCKREDYLSALEFVEHWDEKPRVKPDYFGDGHAAGRIVDILVAHGGL